MKTSHSPGYGRTMPTDNVSDAAQLLLDIADKEGVAVSTVANGHILVFTVKQLNALIAAAQDAETDKVTVFVKRNDFLN